MGEYRTANSPVLDLHQVADKAIRSTAFHKVTLCFQKLFARRWSKLECKIWQQRHLSIFLYLNKYRKHLTRSADLTPISQYALKTDTANVHKVPSRVSRICKANKCDTDNNPQNTCVYIRYTWCTCTQRIVLEQSQCHTARVAPFPRYAQDTVESQYTLYGSDVILTSHICIYELYSVPKFN